MTQTPPKREPLLQGPRVTLRLGAPSDAPAIVAFYRENREHFRTTDPPRPIDFYTEAFWAERLAASVLEYHDDRSCHLLLFSRHEARAAGGDKRARSGAGASGANAASSVIGYANLSNFVRGAFHACYLGYGIGAEHQGKGLMTEALKLTVEHAFEELRLHRIMANHLPTNERSSKVLSRLGFVKEGYAREYLFINGAWRDHVLTALTNDRWAPPSGRSG
jgi:ribosomal-protein-alanine N-acetyltransferase